MEDRIKEYIKDKSEFIEEMINDLLLDTMYQPSSYGDFQRYKSDVKATLETLQEECKRLGRLEVLSMLTEYNENLRIEVEQ